MSTIRLALCLSLLCEPTLHGIQRPVEGTATPDSVVVELRAEEPPSASTPPATTLERAVDWSGSLIVWAESDDADLVLRVGVPGTGQTLEDDDSGGGTTAYVRLEVEPGQVVRTTVATKSPTSSCEARVRFVAARETSATRAAATLARDLLVRVRQQPVLARPEAGDRIGSALDALLSAEGARDSFEVADCAYLLGTAAIVAELPELARRGWSTGHVWCAANLPEAHPRLQNVRSNLAGALSELGENSAARELLEHALEVALRHQPAEHPDVLRIRVRVGHVARLQGDAQRAVEVLRPVLEEQLRTLPADHETVQRSRLDLASNLRAVRAFDEATTLQEQALAAFLRTRPEDHEDVLTARLALAKTCEARHDEEGARRELEQVLAAYTRMLPDDDDRLHEIRLRLAEVLCTLRDLPAARVLAEKALDHLSRTRPETDEFLQQARVTMAAVLRRIGDIPSARLLMDRVVAARVHTLPADDPRILSAQQNLAVLLSDEGEFAAALALEEQILASRLHTLPEDHADVQWARHQLGVGYYRQGDMAAARAMLERVLDSQSRTTPDDDPDVQSTRLIVLATLANLGDAAAFSPLLRRYIAGLDSWARSTIEHCSPREAEARAAGFHREISLALAFSRGFAPFDVDPALEREAFALVETLRAAGLRGTHTLRQAGADARLDSLREASRFASVELARLVAAESGFEDVSRARARLDTAQRAWLERAGEIAGAGGTSPRPTVEAVAARLGPDEAAIGYIRTRRWEIDTNDLGRENYSDVLMAHVVRADGSLRRFVLGPADAIEAQVARWRAALGTGSLPRGLGAATSGEATESEWAEGRALRALVFDPLLPGLAGARRLFVTADDMVHAVPLDALPDADAGGGDARLGDRLRLEMHLSLWELVAAERRDPAPRRMLALGGVDFDARPRKESSAELAPAAAAADPAPQAEVDATRSAPGRGAWSFAPLPGSALEVRRIRELRLASGGTADEFVLLEGRRADRATLEALAPTAGWLHVATHGWFAPESVIPRSDPSPIDEPSGAGARVDVAEHVKRASPMLLCGLALAGANGSGGVVTAEEMASWDLSACALAVLSACDTNVGERADGQGVASLQKALHMAGARSVITSLWRVSDEATAELMSDFYRRLWVEGRTKQTALWEAKSALRSARDASGAALYATRDWAGWVLTGDPR